MKKTTILFGAGADRQFDISGGKNFARNVLGINTTNLNDAIKKFYNKGNFSSHNSWYPKYQEKAWKDKDLLEAAIKKYILDEKTKINTRKDYTEQIIRKRTNMTEKEKERVLDQHTSYMGILDERFHTLIAPQALGPYKFWSVVQCYTRAYLSIVGEILYEKAIEDISTDEYYHILEHPKETIERINNACLSPRFFDPESYYSILKTHKNICVVTTNYTPCCEKISEVHPEQIAYVHGKLGLFESPFEWQIYDAKNDLLPKDELLFPYLFVQSGIKPIVDRTQIQEYHKMLNFFDSSERIVIVGYRINADDNHINGMLRSAIITGKKKVIYLDYDKNSSEDIIRKRLRLTNESKNFIWKPINEKNSLSVFEKNLSN